MALTDAASLHEAENVLQAALTAAQSENDEGALGSRLALVRCLFWRGRYGEAARVLAAVEPAQITILSGNGGEVTATTQEDFTQKVAVGSKVTAWYSVRDGANVLDWMEYPRENFFVPAEQIRTQIRKVIILPSSEVPDADGLFDAMADYLESFDWYVAPRELAEQIRDRALKPHATAATDSGFPRSTLDAINPSTGEFDISRYTQAEGDGGRRSQTQSQPVRDTRKPTPRPM